jgi:hypothetical protein
MLAGSVLVLFAFAAVTSGQLCLVTPLATCHDFCDPRLGGAPIVLLALSGEVADFNCLSRQDLRSLKVKRRNKIGKSFISSIIFALLFWKKTILLNNKYFPLGNKDPSRL